VAYSENDVKWRKAAMFRATVSSARCWARSMIGWRQFGTALPNDANHALARLEANGRSQMLLTQNVDRLHQAAGSRVVIDLHGRLDLVRCLKCATALRRAGYHDDLIRLNTAWTDLDATALLDGDSELDNMNFSVFAVPQRTVCGGVMKPDVVFFGESVPRDQVVSAMAASEQADAMLVIGSSLMVYPGFRFAQTAAGSAYL
jgi:NAD-dependent SIR2 family protein deacetylase